MHEGVLPGSVREAVENARTRPVALNSSADYYSVRDLARALDIDEKTLYHHLSHLRRRDTALERRGHRTEVPLPPRAPFDRVQAKRVVHYVQSVRNERPGRKRHRARARGKH